MTYPTIVNDGEVIFDVSPPRRNLTRIKMTLMSWVCPYGLVIPVEPSSYNVKMWMERGRIDVHSGFMGKALLLDHQGDFASITIARESVNEAPVVEVMYFDTLKGSNYVRASTSEIEEHVIALFTLGYSNAKIMDYLYKNTRLGGPTIQRYTIDELKAFLVEHRVSKPFPFHSSVFFRNELKD